MGAYMELWVMKRYTGKYSVRWTNKDGITKSKVYDDYSTALKAQKWLLENNAENIDIAVKLEDKVEQPYYDK